MKGITGFILSVFVLMYFLPVVYAQETLQWSACVREALERHPDLVSAEEKVKQTRADKVITQSAALPQISSSLDASTGGSTTANRQTGQTVKTTTDSYSYGVSGKQLLFDGFKTSHDITAARRTLEAAEYEYLVVSSDVRLALRSAFVGLLRAQELVAITEEIASRRKQNLDLVRLRYDAGREHEGSLLTAEADLAQAEFEVQQAGRNLRLVQRELINELGRETFTPLRVKGEFTVMNEERQQPDFEKLADDTPLLRELVIKTEAARYGLKSARADFFPQVYLDGTIGKTESYWPPGNKSWSAGVSLSFPLFEGASRVAKVSKAKAELGQARADQRSGRDSVIYTMEEAWKSFQDSIDKVTVQKKYLLAAEKRATIASAQYSTGLISFDDWIIIEDTLVDARKSFLDSQANMLLAEAAWVQAKGGILSHEK